MGFYDRNYERDSYGGYSGGSYGQPGLHLRMPQSMTMRLLLLTVAVYVVQLFVPGILEFFALHEDWYRQPWRIVGFLTYGFLHSEEAITHLLFNMVALYFFGSAVEERYGRREFLWLYLVGIVFSGIVWNLSELATPTGRTSLVVGASGAISTILALFILNFPHAKVYIYFLFPVPAWVLGIFWVASDAFGAITQFGNVAFTAHLGGGLFGLLYYKLGWRLTDWMPRDFRLPRFKRRPPLKVHRGDDDDINPLDAEIDRILQKINERGQDSLTAAEKRTLQKGSAAYKKRRQ